jgi:signal transduction histidine kinase
MGMSKTERHQKHLTISLGIVQGHGGRITVESQVGQGSTFTVWLSIET